jgi:hypothetical protein
VRAKLLARIGHPDEGERLAREAVTRAEKTPDLLLLRADAHLDLAEVLFATGQRSAAAPPIETGLELYERKGNVVSASASRARLAQLQSETESSPLQSESRYGFPHSIRGGLWLCMPNIELVSPHDDADAQRSDQTPPTGPERPDPFCDPLGGVVAFNVAFDGRTTLKPFARLLRTNRCGAPPRTDSAAKVAKKAMSECRAKSGSCEKRRLTSSGAFSVISLDHSILLGRLQRSSTETSEKPGHQWCCRYAAKTDGCVHLIRTQLQTAVGARERFTSSGAFRHRGGG